MSRSGPSATGRTATADQAQEVCAAIRKVVGELYGEDAARGLTVQYGGSMNAENAAELLAKPDVERRPHRRRFAQSRPVCRHCRRRHQRLSPPGVQPGVERKYAQPAIF